MALIVFQVTIRVFRRGTYETKRPDDVDDGLEVVVSWESDHVRLVAARVRHQL